MTTQRLKNVCLETNFVYENGRVIHTDTDLFTLELKQGKIASVNPNMPAAEGMDAEGLLALPTFKDWHTHLDKHRFGLPWKAHHPQHHTVRDMIAHEQEIIPQLLDSAVERGEALIAHYQSFGTDFARSHVNIDPTSGLQSLEKLQEALRIKQASFTSELVAFPQHGLFYTPSTDLMKKAAALPEIDFIGGVDPIAIDGDLGKSMDFTVNLALDYGKGIDLHLHETDAAGVATIQYLIDRVNQHPELSGKTFVSHAYVFGFLKEAQVEDLAQRLAAAGIGIISTIPFAGFTMPLPLLKKHGVDLRIGTDNIVDHWSTFGSANLLQTVNRAARLYGWQTEFELSRALQYATGGRLPLDDQGRRQWPKPGDWADFLLIDASCSAEAVSRISPVNALIHSGKRIDGKG